MKIRLILTACLPLFACLTSCIGTQEEQPTPPATQAFTTEFDGFSVTAPQYAFVNEPFELTINDNEGTTTQSTQLEHHSGFAPPKCCVARVFYAGQFHNLHIPTYNNVLYLGPPITIKANRNHAIGLTLDDGFLQTQGDAVKSISWQQTSGNVTFSVSSDNTQVNFTTTDVSDIERWVFKATINTLHGRVFSQEKIVFVIPEGSWVDALQVYEGNSDSIVALRSNQTLYASDKVNEHHFLAAPADNIRHIASLSAFLIFAATDNALFEADILTGEWHQVPQDFGRITFMIDAASARHTMYIVNEEGNVYSSHADYKLLYQGVISATPYLISGANLTTMGTITSQKDNSILFEGIKQFHSQAFLNNEGKVGTIYGSPDLDVFEPYNDYTFVTSTKEGFRPFEPTYDHHIFALRPNGSVVSTSRLPPLLRNITAISSGTGTHAALAIDGTVYRWGFQPKGDVHNGKIPNPINLTQQAFNAYRSENQLNR